MGADNNRSSQAAAEAREYAESIVETLHEPLLVLSSDLTVKSVNPAFYKHFKVDPDETIGRKIYDLGNGQWDIPALRELLEEVLPDSNVFNNYEVRHDFRDIGERVMLLNARRLNHNQLILLGIRDITERRRAEREIADARKYAESIVETFHEPLLVLHPDLTVKSVNPAFYEHFEVDPNDTIGQKIYDLGNGQWKIPALRTLLEDVLPDSKVFNDYEVTHDFEDIGERIMLLNARRLDHVQLILLGIRDITEKQQAENAVRDSKQHLQALVLASSNVVYSMSPDWRQLSMLEGQGFLTDQDDPSESWLEKYIPPGERKRVQAAIQDAIDRKSVFELEHRVIRRDGTVGWTFSRAIPILGGSGEIVEWFGAASDITDRKQSEANLRESETRYRSLFDSIAEGFCVFEMIYDDNGEPFDYRFIEVNPAFERHTGLVNVVGKTVRELVPAPEPHWFEIYDRVAKTGEPVSFEERGEQLGRWFRVSAFQSGEPDGKTVAVLFADITEQKRAEEDRLERERLKMLVAGQEEERKRIARDLHDELGQQLTALRLKLENLAGDASASSPIREIMKLAKKIDDGVDFIAWELRPAALQEDGLIEALRRYVNEWSGYSGVMGTLVTPSNWPTAGEIVETALYRVVQEAMNNINKHADAKTAVVTLTRQGSNTLLTIDDDGRGFDPEEVKKKRGLGLIGMQERVEMVGDTFEIESTPDRGTTIFAKFPTQPVPARLHNS